MVYRRTDRVVRRLHARRAAILSAARAAAEAGGMAAVQIVPVAERAEIAAGTMYRYFPSKTALVAALVEAASEQDIAAMRAAAESAPGPLSALAAAIATFAGRALHDRRFTFALLAEPVDADTDAVRRRYRDAVAAELEVRVRTVAAEGLLPEQDAALTALAVLGALIEGLIGPLAPDCGTDRLHERNAVQAVTLLALRAVGVADARARGLVVQTALPMFEAGADRGAAALS